MKNWILILTVLSLALAGCGTGDKGPLQCGVAECEDGDPCTLDCLQGSSCINPLMSAKTVCEDGDLCTFGETCDESGSCTGGQPVEVEQALCQTCSCDPDKGIECNWSAIGDYCDDGDCCKTGRYCDWCDPDDPTCEVGNMVCNGAPKDCSDDNSCTDDSCSCENGTSTCDYDAIEDGLECEFSANDCTIGDSCQAGECVPGDPIDLNDNNACTQDYCDKGEVVHKALIEGSCNDGDECTIDDHCYLGSCVGGSAFECPLGQCASSVECITGEGCIEAPLPTGAPCDDGNECTTVSACNKEHLCQASQIKSCDDFNPCTLDSCDVDTGDCNYVILEGSCDDGNACTLNDGCKINGSCEGELTLCDDGNPCMQTTCNATTGLCDLPVPDGSPCNDDSLCNGAESCLAGTCLSSEDIDCSDIENGCLQNICNPETGSCDLQKADGTGCEDGNQCTTNDTCATGQCIPGGEVVCEQEPCAGSVSCEPSQGCVSSWLPVGAQCDDSNPCTLGSTCSFSNTCDATETLDCDDGNPCTADSCDTATGACINEVQAIACDDGSLCTNDDLCQADGSCEGVAVDCSGVTDLCIESSCNPLTGACDLAKADGTACPDGDLCNGDELCLTGACIAGDTIVCDINPGLCRENICQPLTGVCAELTSSDCCGNNSVDEGENCDDGNIITEVCPYGDLSCTVCSDACQQVSGAISQCGDNSTDVADGEECDDGNTDTEPCDYGLTNCTVCSGACTIVSGETSYCGDTVIDVSQGETCDDGNSITETCDYGALTCTVCADGCTFDAGLTSFCGDGVVDDANGEACDDGNNLNGDCCSAACTIEPVGTICRSSVDLCDSTEFCDGSSPVCPGDTLQALGFECRAKAGDCDVAETCTGTDVSCPTDEKEPSSLICRASNGVCDLDEYCDGITNACATDEFKVPSTVCRVQSGVCDLEERCTGSSAACPTDGKVSSTNVCRSSAGDCDLEETCDGLTNDCPPDSFKNPSTQCRTVAGACDLAENCTGTDALCPVDSKAPSSQTCRTADGVCDLVETCDGLSDDCPSNLFKDASIVCRAQAGICDVSETCTGSSPNCPFDTKASASIVCRDSAGVCDIVENCDGATNSCPSNQFQVLGTICRPSAGTCDLDESCTGTDALCPIDAKETVGTICRGTTGICDIDEVCDGSTNDCPIDELRSPSFVCRAQAGVCDVAENCTGLNETCPSDAKAPSSQVCRISDGSCDLDEQCTGSSDNCPSNQLKSPGTICRAATNECDIEEICDGGLTACPSDSFVISGVTCDDSDPFTKDDACDGAGLCAGIPPVCGDGAIDFGEDCDGPGCCGCSTATPNPIGCVVANTVINLLETKDTPADTKGNQRYGSSVAIDGDTIVGGSTFDADSTFNGGSIYILTRSDFDWILQKKITNPSGVEGDLFGHAVAISGDTVVVGAPNADNVDESTGAAYVFVRSGTNWVQQQKLEAPDLHQNLQYGYSVAIDGNRMIIGTQDLNGSGLGGAYLYTRFGSTWMIDQKVLPAATVINDLFGTSVDISGNRAVVGARSEDGIGNNSGAAYIFEASGTTWTETQRLIASDETGSDSFGSAVAIDGETIIIGAHANADAGANTGAAYVFTRSGSIYTEKQKLLAQDANGGDWFGFALSIEGDRLLIGAGYDDHPGIGVNSGSAYLFDRNAGVWTQTEKLIAFDSKVGDLYAKTVAISQSNLVVGSSLSDIASMSNAGALYIYTAAPNCTDPNNCECKPGFLGPLCADTECGDNIIAGPEACDDGNTITEDCLYGETSCTVCNASCEVIVGDTSYCGDFIIQGGESCDDGNAFTESCVYGETSCVVCNNNCQNGPGADTFFCGDGTIDLLDGEECDDSNLTTNDGCNACGIEKVCASLNLNDIKSAKIPDHPDFNLPAFTIAFWVKPTGNFNTWNMAIRRHEYWFVGVDNNQKFKAGLSYGDGGSEDIHLTANGAVPNQWHHVAFTYDAGFTATLWINGNSQTSATGSETSNANVMELNDRPIHISDLESYFFVGNLADFVLYDTALNSAQINNLKNGNYSSIGLLPVGHWPLNHALGSILHDIGPNEHDASTINGPSWSSSSPHCP